MITFVKVFSATMARDRESLGEKATEWLAARRRQTGDEEEVEIRTLQSSDSEYHCLSIVAIWRSP